MNEHIYQVKVGVVLEGVLVQSMINLKGKIHLETIKVMFCFTKKFFIPKTDPYKSKKIALFFSYWTYKGL